MIEWKLYMGTKNTGIVLRPDEKYSSMWRVHWPDREPSDMVNLARAKDATMCWAGRGGGEDKHRLKWIPPKQARGGSARALNPSEDTQGA